METNLRWVFCCFLEKGLQKHQQRESEGMTQGKGQQEQKCAAEANLPSREAKKQEQDRRRN